MSNSSPDIEYGTKDYGDKGQVAHNEYLRDHDIIAGTEAIAREQAMHMGELNEEELATEKLLVRKIDSLIMPLVILVYLMNYIDR